MSLMNREDTLAIFVDFQEKLMPAISERELVEDRTIRLAGGLNVLGVPHIVTQQYTKGLGETVPPIAEAIGDYEAVEKTCFSCMNNVDFVNKLELAEKKNIIVCGVETHICVQQTVLQLLDEGYSVYVPVDCVSSRSRTDYLWATERMEKAGAVLTTCESILFELLRDARADGFKEISAIVK